MTRLPPSVIALLAAALLTGCDGWQTVEPPTPPPFDDDDATDEPVAITPQLLPGAVANPDAGWIATNTSHSWTSLSDRAGGEPFRVASVVYVVGSLRDWFAPADGSVAATVATGNRAGVVIEALDQGRYVAFRLHANSVDDLPPAWETTTDEPGFIPHGRVSLVQVDFIPDPGDDDDDSATDDDDSAADDDDSAADDDDDSARSEPRGGGTPVYAPNYSDPDYRDLVSGMLSALAERFASETGLAFVDVSGVGRDGGWDFDDTEPWFGPAAVFTEASWAAQVITWIDIYEGLFNGVPLFLPYRALALSGEAADDITPGLEKGLLGLRDDCAGGCTSPDVTRFPGEPGSPYPADDPYGGWFPGELYEDHPILYASGQGGIGSMRLADATGAWDSSTFGPFASYMATQFDTRFRHGPASFVTLSGTPCTSEWVIAADPPPSACAQQSPGSMWPPITEYGERAGYRYVVTEVRLRPDWENVGTLEVELDVENQGAARAHRDRQVHLAFVDEATGEATVPVEIELEEPTSSWGPGESVTLTAELTTSELSFGTDDRWALTIRLLDSRAYDGGIRLPHPVIGSEARHVLATWPAAD